MSSTNVKRTLTANGLTNIKLIYLALSVAMLAISGYLLNHYYQLYFPSGLDSGGGLCDISSFWNCDTTSKSAMGSFLNVPTAFFGIVIGLIGLFGALFSTERVEANNKIIFYLNALGCVVFLAYSLIELNGLCPMCTLYYLCSWAMAFLFYRYSDVALIFDYRFTTFYVVLFIIPGYMIKANIEGRMKAQSSLSSQYVTQFKKLKNLGEPTIASPFLLNKATENFSKAPIRISIFSDFECPFCGVISSQIHKIVSGLEDKVNIQYFFYPLDRSCNPKMKSDLHRYACYASYLAVCAKERFAEVHDYIFDHQKELSRESIQAWAKKFNVDQSCLDSAATKEAVSLSISAADQFKLKSTPTVIINGRKIEGSIPTVHFRAILQAILKEKL